MGDDEPPDNCRGNNCPYKLAGCPKNCSKLPVECDLFRKYAPDNCLLAHNSGTPETPNDHTEHLIFLTN